jgi:Tol biopolymer transport system component
MSTERWQRLERIFAEARQLSVEAQSDFVARACGADETLRREALSLLAADDAPGEFMAKPALDRLAQSVASEGWSLQPGERIGAYTILRLLGAGGAGEVWRARDERLGRDVAIKILLPHFSNDAERLRRFADEARAAGALNHSNILTVYDVGEIRGIPFLVSECLEGQSLRQRMDAGPLLVDEAVAIALACARGLAAAHVRGIIHRDLKPENTFIRSDGGVKILDFGMAKLQSALADVDSDASHTMTGVIVGTAGYMAPEQVKGEHVDARTDLFALGAVLYEMLCGRHPFRRASTFETLHAVLTIEPPDLLTANAHVPVPLGRIVMRLLEKPPAARFQSALDLGSALERVSAGPSDVASGVAQPSGSTPSWRSRRVAWLTAPAVIAVVLLTAGSFAWRAWRAPDNWEPPRAIPLTTLPGVERYPSFSPDGNHVAFTWNGPKQDNRDIYVQQIGAGSPLRLTTEPSSDYSPVWSPDGRWIAFLRDQSEAGKNDLRLIAPLGGPERKLAEIRPQSRLLRSVSLAWCPDSNCLVVTDSAGEGKPDALFVVSLESGEKRQLTYPLHPIAGDTDPAVSPDGNWVVFRRNASPFVGELYRLPLGKGLIATGEPSRLTLTALDANNPTWMPDSKEILFSAKGGLWRLAVSGTRAPTRLPFVGEDGLMPVVSRPQPGRPLRLVYVRSYADSNIWRVETSHAGATATSPPVVAISSTRWDATPQFSPDGRRVAFTSSRSGELEVWLADADGSNAVPLTSMGAVPGFPSWSPDGGLVAFHSNPEGQAEVYVIPTAGGRPRNLTSHPGADTFPSFSRDGRWIYFSSNRTGGNPVIWKVPSSGGDAVRVTNSIGNYASESPDGADIYYNEAWDRPSSVWRLSGAGGVAVKVLEGVVRGSFTVLERGIYYIDRPSGKTGGYSADGPGEPRLQYFDLATHRSTTVAPNLGNVGLGFTSSPDGRTILYSRVDASVDDLMLVENFR